MGLGRDRAITGVRARLEAWLEGTTAAAAQARGDQGRERCGGRYWGTAADGWERGLQAHGTALGSGKGDEGTLQRLDGRARGSKIKGTGRRRKAPAAEDEQQPGKELAPGGRQRKKHPGQKPGWRVEAQEGKGLVSGSAGARGSPRQS